MSNSAKVDLLTIALELRLAAHEGGSASRRLTTGRLSEMAEVLEGIAHQAGSGNQSAEVVALRSLAASAPVSTVLDRRREADNRRAGRH